MEWYLWTGGVVLLLNLLLLFACVVRTRGVEDECGD